MTRYIQVDCIRTANGTEKPSVIHWPDGRYWSIKKVLHTSLPSDREFDGIRYTVLIGQAKKYIYKDDKGWYVVAPS